MFGIENEQLYSFSFLATGDTSMFQLLQATLQVNDQDVIYLFTLEPTLGGVLPPYRMFETRFKLHRKSSTPVALSVIFGVTVQISGTLALDDVQLVAGAHVVGDPVFSGFHAQHFRVTGAPARVFNLLSMRRLQVNSRFVSLSAGQSIGAAEMKTIRSLMEITGAATAVASSLFVPPPTTAYSHPGTYLGSAGVKLSGHRLYVQAGEYRLGFANVSLDGEPLPVSEAVQVLADGSQLHRPTPFSISITTAELTFTLVNADHFLNFESAALLQPIAALRHRQHEHAAAAHSAEDDKDCLIAGLLGQTADPEWQVQKTDGWRRHLELDHLLQGDDLFGDDFATNLYEA